MPVFPWRFIDSLLGRSRPGDAEPADAAWLSELQARLLDTITRDAGLLEHVSSSDAEQLLSWSRAMLARRAPSVLGWTRRDAAVQLGAVSGAIRAVLRAIDEVLAESSDEVSERRSWRLMALDSEIASPLYSVEEQAPIRARLRSLAEAPNPPGVTTAAGGVVARIVEAMTPPER